MPYQHCQTSSIELYNKKKVFAKNIKKKLKKKKKLDLICGGEATIDNHSIRFKKIRSNQDMKRTKCRFIVF